MSAALTRSTGAIKRVKAGNTSVLVREGAGSRTLILVHGIGSEAASFTPLMQTLDPNLTVIAWDLPGYGSSPAPGFSKRWDNEDGSTTSVKFGEPDAGDYASELLAALDVLGVRRAALLGHSLGALVVASYAARRRSRTEAVILACPALGYDAGPRDPLPAIVQGRLDEYVRLGAEGYASLRAPRLLHDPDGRPNVLAAVRDAISRVTHRGLACACELLGRGSLPRDLAGASVPTLVIAAAKDQVTPLANAEQAFAALAPEYRTGSGPLVIPDSGHALPQEQPEALARHIETFLASVEPRHGR